MRAALESGLAVFGAGRVVRTPDLRLRDYVGEAWHIPEPSAFQGNWHIDAICEHLEAVTRNEIRDLVINIPPRFGKSLLVSVFWPTWEWTFQAHIRWIFSSYSQGLSLRDSLKCRHLIESNWYQRRWGHVYQLTDDQNAKGLFANDRTGYRLATSVEGQGTGLGGDRIVVDDPHNANEAESDTKREGTVRWWRRTMSTRGNNPKTVTRVIVMQRLHERDLAGQMLAMTDDAEDAEPTHYEHLILPMEYDPKRSRVTVLGWTDPRQEKDELLWPERFDRPAVEKLKQELGSYAAAAQLQQSPAPSGGTIVKDEWWRYYEVLPSTFEGLLLTMDAAFKGEDDDADYVVIQAWGRVRADSYLLDQVRAKLEFLESRRGLLQVAKVYPAAQLKLVEDKANGPAIISSLKRHIPGLVPYEPPGDLISRVRAIAPVIESGNVFLPGPVQARRTYERWRTHAATPEGKWLPAHFIRPGWVEEFVHEWSFFPRAANDDTVAAGVMALERFDRQRLSVSNMRRMDAATEEAVSVGDHPAHRRY